MGISETVNIFVSSSYEIDKYVSLKSITSSFQIFWPSYTLEKVPISSLKSVYFSSIGVFVFVIFYIWILRCQLTILNEGFYFDPYLNMLKKSRSGNILLILIWLKIFRWYMFILRGLIVIIGLVTYVSIFVWVWNNFFLAVDFDVCV